MFTSLRKVAAGATVVMHHRSTYLWKTLRCRICSGSLRLSRFVSLHPTGIRGYYGCGRGHVVAIDRSGVTRVAGSDGSKIYFR